MIDDHWEGICVTMYSSNFKILLSRLEWNYHWSFNFLKKNAQFSLGHVGVKPSLKHSLQVSIVLVTHALNVIYPYSLVVSM